MSRLIRPPPTQTGSAWNEFLWNLIPEFSPRDCLRQPGVEVRATGTGPQARPVLANAETSGNRLEDRYGPLCSSVTTLDSNDCYHAACTVSSLSQLRRLHYSVRPNFTKMTDVSV